MKHGEGGKWYLNAKNYSNELAEKMNFQEYLTEQWRFFENVYIRKIMGFSSIDLGYKLLLPIIGRILRSSAERMIHSEGKNRNPVRADGHFGQVIPLEDAKVILGNLAAEPIIENYCMCRWMQRGMKELCCINFGVLSGVIEKLPRFIPKNSKVRLNRDEAIERIEQHNRKGYVASVWFQPVPYINAICSCEIPECGGLRLRNDFGFNTVYKSEYAMRINPDKCQGCLTCIPRCQFGALRHIPSLDRVTVNPDKCYGCGVCRHACKHDAMEIVPRDEIPSMKGHY
jgi:NAD-dependent dihydropyrimidine dehydrogenase PreA subunit